MALLKCKICGGDVEYDGKSGLCTCKACDTLQVVPEISSERIEALHDRANRCRMDYEFDKALELYNLLLADRGDDPDIYWAAFLCRYGVVFVEDRKTGAYVPTINRVQYTSVLSDPDYLKAVEYASDAQRKIYEDRGKELVEIQRRILSVSDRSEKFDVFICYKENDDAGRRTPDSVLANEIYHQLDKDGIKTFFARITLEDKLGSEYEPIIFSALNSAKVMLVIGTNPEFFESVWVKNEWARFISYMESDDDKTLIPLYKNMDPYELPKAFSNLQALNMDKLGFMQDLLHGVKKLLGIDDSKAEVVEDEATVDPKAAIVKMGIDYIESNDFKSADMIFEKLLNVDPEYGDAYLGKALVQNSLHSLEELEARIDAEFEEIKKVGVKSALLREWYVEGYYTYSQMAKKIKSSFVDLSEYATKPKVYESFEKGNLKWARLYCTGHNKEFLDKMYDKIAGIGYEPDLEGDERLFHLKNGYEGALKRREADYHTLVDRVEYITTNKDKNVEGIDRGKELEVLSGKFFKLGKYKDSAEMASYCMDLSAEYTPKKSTPDLQMIDTENGYPAKSFFCTNSGKKVLILGGLIYFLLLLFTFLLCSGVLK